MKTFDIVKEDIYSFCKEFGFSFKETKDGFYVLQGTIDIKDPKDGFIWDSFKIEYHLRLNEYVKENTCKRNLDLAYPKCLPHVYLIDHLLLKDPKYHITNNGKCCLSPDVECFEILSANYNLCDFTNKLVIPFFANQIYFQKTGRWAFGDYKHYEEGLIDYYSEKINVDREHVLSGLEVLSQVNKISRNDICFCGSNKKYKNCHKNVLDALIFHVPNFYMVNDYKKLKEYLIKN